MSETPVFVEIIDVSPNAIKDTARSLQVGDELFDVFGGHRPIRKVTTSRERVRVWLGADTTPDVFRADDTITFIPNPKLDRAGSASRQHYIETGLYLSHDEVAEANPQEV